jgi:DNA-binding MarR family transcriptional regulator
MSKDMETTEHRSPTLGYLLSDSLRLLRRRFNKRSRGSGLTPALARLLYYIHRDPGSRQIDLAQLLEVTPVTLGRMLDRLARLHYITRTPDPVDRRVVRVFTTEAAAPTIDQLSSFVNEGTRAALAGISQERQQQLFELLEQIILNLNRNTP